MTSIVSKFRVERLNLRKLRCRGKEQFRVEVSNRFTALEDLDTEVELNSAWETIREIINISAKESLVRMWWTVVCRTSR
jgi:hypothetical protein